MKNLEIRQLNEDGYMIAAEPALNGGKPERMTVTISLFKGDFIEKLEDVAMVKIYHDKMIMVFLQGDEREFDFTESNQGEILVNSTANYQSWYLRWSQNLTAMVQFKNDGIGNWSHKEGVIFIGCQHGREEIIVVEGDNIDQVSDLYNVLPHYAEHYKKLLESTAIIP